MKDLTYTQILALKPGRHWASESLYVFVAPDSQTRRFIFRYTKPSTGKVTEKGLGRLDRDITLAEAKEKGRRPGGRQARACRSRHVRYGGLRIHRSPSTAVP